MDSLNALIQGMGLMHLSAGQAVMLLVSLVLLWLAIVKKFEPLLLLPIGFGGLLSNIPEAGLAMTGQLRFTSQASWRLSCWEQLQLQRTLIWHWYR